MNPLDALAAATDHFDRVLAQVPDDAWDRVTPCPDWTVREVADHVTGGNRWAVLLLDGVEGREALATVRAGTFGPDRLADYRASVAAQHAAFAAPDALDREVEHVVGRISARQFLGMRLTDNVLHSWDLARGAGLDDTLPEPLVHELISQLEPVADMMAHSGMFGSGHHGAGEAQTPQERLLHLAGRRP